MRRLTLALTILPPLAGIACSGQTALRLPFQGLSPHAVHRFFPDLDRRENAIRYGLWNALESEWTGGSAAARNAALERPLREAIRRRPTYPPDARLCAPRFSRDAPRTFGAVLRADDLEREVADALAATDASASSIRIRIEKSLTAYRRSPYALSEPAPAEGESRPEDFPVSTILRAGDRLFARSAEDLLVPSFREQRWRVRKSVESFDREVQGASDAGEPSAYAREAPEFAQAHPLVAAALDRAARFRGEVLEALGPADEASRRTRLESVEKRYALR